MRVAGVFLLSTFLLSLAESAWAMTCDPGVAGSPGTSWAGAPGGDAMAAGHEHSSGHDHDRRDQRDPDRDCPFAPAGASGCAVSATLPAVMAEVAAPAPVKDVRRPATAVHVSDPLARSIFHPPKA